MTKLVKIEFVKDYLQTIKKGEIHEVAPKTAKRWVSSKFAKYVK